MDFINIKKYKIKKITTNIFIPILLGAIILIGSTISVAGYNLNVPKSFAKETRITSSFGSNPDPQQNSPSHHHTSVQSSLNPNPDPQQNSPIHHNTAAVGQSVVSIDPTAMSVPFSGVNGISGVSTLVSAGGSSVGHTSDPLCGALTETAGNTKLTQSVCNNHSGHHPVFTFTKSLTNSKSFDKSQSDTRFHVVGPDKFKFINSYWTSGETSRTIDAGSSANNTFLGAGSANTNTKLETDINKGPTTLAVRLQYEGVVQLSGITAALKLPAGFTSGLPLIDDPNRHDIAFSNYEGNIYPGQGVVLYFSINILNNTKLTPYLAPLALHVLRADERVSTDGIDAAQQDQFASTLNIQNASSPFSVGFDNNNSNPSTRTFNDNGSFSETFHKVNERLKPFDFVNQIIPVLFKITGEETLVVNVLPGTGPAANTTVPSSPFLVLAPPGLPTTVRLLINNTGDAPVYDLTATVSPRSESALGATVVPSATNIPNVVQQNAIQPLVLIGPTQKNVGFIPPKSSAEVDVTIVPSFYVGGTVENLFVNMEYNNVVGQDANLTLPIGVEILPVTGQAALHNALQVPTSVTHNPLHVSNELSNRALNAMTNIELSNNAANNAVTANPHQYFF